MTVCLTGTLVGGYTLTKNTLVRLANEAGGNDNISLIVLSFSERAG